MNVLTVGGLLEMLGLCFCFGFVSVGVGKDLKENLLAHQKFASKLAIFKSRHGTLFVINPSFMNNIRVIIKEDGLIRDRIIPNKVGNVVGKVLTKLYQKCS